MAISVDTVYQRVLALANKEQRGYITPQEFNLLANQAQIGIFESYFYDKNQRERQEENRPNEIDETDISELISAKLAPFRLISAVTSGHTFLSQVTINSIARDVFQVGRVFKDDDVCHKLPMNEVSRMLRSKRHIITTADQFPIYCDSTTAGQDIQVYAGTTNAETTINAEYFAVPAPVEWTYVVVNNKALYNGTTGVVKNFELHKSETNTVVMKILELASVIMNKPGLVTIATTASAQEASTQKI